MSTITGTVIKESVDSKVGIAFAQLKNDPQGPLTIKEIRESGLFAATHLVAGLTVLSINGESVVGKSAKEAADLLRLAEGEVSVVTEGTLAQVEKETADVKMGISLLRNVETGHIVVTAIREECLFSPTNIKVGQRCIAINGKPCPVTTKEAINALREAVGTVTIITTGGPAPEADEMVEEAVVPVSSAQDVPTETVSKDASEVNDRDMPEQAPVHTMSEDKADMTVDSSTSSKPSKAGGSWLESLWSICF